MKSMISPLGQCIHAHTTRTNQLVSLLKSYEEEEEEEEEEMRCISSSDARRCLLVSSLRIA